MRTKAIEEESEKDNTEDLNWWNVERSERK